MSNAQPYYLEDDGTIPNNALPLLVYPSAVDSVKTDRASAFEQLFAGNGWTHSWRNGIYSFPHYHSTAHEVLGIASGSARVRLGGEAGVVLEVSAGDALLLPAGVGHQNVGSSADLIVVGAYPQGADWDLCRPPRGQAELDHIADVALPPVDPVSGSTGGINDYWKTAKPTVDGARCADRIPSERNTP